MFVDEEDPRLAAALERQRMNQIPANTTINAKLSCARCGALGHSVENCHEDLPSVDEMMSEIEAKIARAVASAGPEWKQDSMGLYVPGGGAYIDRSKSFKDGPFCLNCGAFGHTDDVCMGPTRAQVQAFCATQKKGTITAKQICAHFNYA